MDAKHQSLALSDEIARYLEQARVRFGLEKADMQVLDFGCKDGRAVLELLRQGYSAYGIDIESNAVAKGQQILETDGFDPARLVCWDDPASPSSLPEARFHFVYSFHVFEHVEDAQSLVREIARVSRPGGEGLHIFPAPYRPIEAHISMPLVHWLPKGPLRKGAIYFFATIGIGPAWMAEEKLSSRAARYALYSCTKTYYRTFTEWQRILDEHGISSTEVSARHPRIGRLTRIVGEAIVSRLVRTFRTIECRTTMRAAADRLSEPMSALERVIDRARSDAQGLDR